MDSPSDQTGAATLSPRTSHLALPFFEPLHQELARGLDVWAAAQASHTQPHDHRNVDRACRHWVTQLGSAGHLRWCVPAAHGGALPALDSRALVVARETLARHDGLADFALAMQGLGSGAITLAGSPAL
jgi:acyl-CoA dehydrogenase